MRSAATPQSRSPSPANDDAPEAGPPTPWYRTPWPWVFLFGIVCLTLMRPLLRREPPPPPVLSELPRFELVSTDGSPFGSAELDGHVWIAHFFFTRCVSICPRLISSIASLRQRLDEAGLDEVRLVGISVDPAHDSPERLAEYGRAHEIDPNRWTLLTGDPLAVRRLAVEGFRVPVGDAQATDAGIVDIAHTGKLVLVDERGAIRGYYETDELGLDEVFHRSRHVLEHPR